MAPPPGGMRWQHPQRGGPKWRHDGSGGRRQAAVDGRRRVAAPGGRGERRLASGGSGGRRQRWTAVAAGCGGSGRAAPGSGWGDRGDQRAAPAGSAGGQPRRRVGGGRRGREAGASGGGEVGVGGPEGVGAVVRAPCFTGRVRGRLVADSVSARSGDVVEGRSEPRIRSSERPRSSGQRTRWVRVVGWSWVLMRWPGRIRSGLVRWSGFRATKACQPPAMPFSAAIDARVSPDLIV